MILGLYFSCWDIGPLLYLSSRSLFADDRISLIIVSIAAFVADIVCYSRLIGNTRDDRLAIYFLISKLLLLANFLQWFLLERLGMRFLSSDGLRR